MDGVLPLQELQLLISSRVIAATSQGVRTCVVVMQYHFATFQISVGAYRLGLKLISLSVILR